MTALLLTGVGKSSLRSAPVAPIVKDSDFTSPTLPSDWTYARGSTGTYRNSSGNLVLAASGVRRIDYSLDGAECYGTLYEPQATNKFTTKNVLPSDGTGMTKSGATLSVLTADNSTQAANYLAAQKLTQLGTNGRMMRLDNSMGGSDAVITFTATFGNTNLHCVSMWGVAIGGSTVIASTGGGTSLTVTTANGFSRVAFNVTPAASGNQVTITVPQGAEFWWWGEQCEEIFAASVGGVAFKEDKTTKARPTSLIPVNGASATRLQDTLTLQNINTKEYYSEAQGCIVVDFIPRGYSATTDQYIASLQQGTGLTNLYQIRMSKQATSPMDPGNIRRGCTSNSTGRQVQSLGKFRLDKRATVALSYRAGGSLIFNGTDYIEDINAVDNTPGQPVVNPTGMDRLVIGSTRSGSVGPFFGHIRRVKIYNKYRGVAQLGPDFYVAGDRIVMWAGQSNAVGNFRAQLDQNNHGQDAANAILDQYLGADGSTIGANGRNIAVCCATNGSLAFGPPGNIDALPWCDSTTGYTLTGQAWIKCRDIMLAILSVPGTTIERAVWKQGDAGRIWSEKDLYKECVNRIFDGMRALVPGLRIGIDQKQRVRSETDGEYIIQPVRESDWEFSVDRPTVCFRLPEEFDIPLDDFVHADSETGYAVMAGRIARGVMADMGYTVPGGVTGPSWSAPVVSGMTITQTLVQESGSGGTDIATVPGGVYEGWVILDRDMSISGWSVRETLYPTKTGTNTVQMTRTTTPAANDELYFIFDQGWQNRAGYTETLPNGKVCPTVNPAYLPKTNAANGLLPKAAKWALGA